MPKRIQRKRTKGWRMPGNTVYVGRGSKFGNPFHVSGFYNAQACVDYFRGWLTTDMCIASLEAQKQTILNLVVELRGRDLACWCRDDEPCHADVLIELANN